MKIGNIINGMTSGNVLNESDVAAFQDMRARIPGWSELLHMAFFKCVAAEMAGTVHFEAEIKRALICGVYHGLDLAMIGGFQRSALRVTGVDLFSAEPCADWPEDKRGMTWEQAFGCAPPDMAAAARNAPRATIEKANSVEYLNEHADTFDFIYLDTSHDEATVAAELEAIKSHAYTEPDQIIAGDDWSVPDARFNCGVAKAVTAAFHDPIVIANRIWIARRSDMK